MATIKDVAKKANLSPTTVSRVLNNRGYISEKTRKLVYDTMEEMNYHPNKIARALLSKKSNIFAVIVPDSSNPFFSELTAEIEHLCQRHNYSLLLCNSLDTYEMESRHLEVLQEQNIDGLMACSHILDSKSYEKISFPIVSFDKDYHVENIPIICSNNTLGGTLAANHLHEKGCRHLLHISGPLSDNSLLGHERYYGFKKYCEHNDLTYENFETNNHFSCEYYYSFIKQTIGNNLSRFDGAFCSNDLIAFALYRCLMEKNIQVPSQFKIVGFDNTNFTKIMTPKLTTIEQDIPKIADAMVSTLLDMQNGGIASKSLNILPVKLIQGETT